MPAVQAAVASATLDTRTIDRAVLSTVAYGDVFDYPLDALEVRRYLHGVTATVEATVAALARCASPRGALSQRDGLYTLRGRESLVDSRSARAAQAARLWPTAVRYGHAIAGLPFVRMVAVTGSLAWNNVSVPDDIDYLVVTEPDHLWVCRWLVALLRRFARLDGVVLCPNFMITERALALAERDLYVAYELTSMTPIAGFDMYRALRRANPWTTSYLPNAVELPSVPDVYIPSGHTFRDRALARLVHYGEGVLRSRLGTVLEAYEMRYRMRKIQRLGTPRGLSSYDVDWYKGWRYPDGHRQHVLASFAKRLQRLESEGIRDGGS